MYWPLGPGGPTWPGDPGIPREQTDTQTHCKNDENSSLNLKCMLCMRT